MDHNEDELFPVSPYFMTDKVTKYLSTGLSAIGNGFEGTYDPALGSSIYCLNYSNSEFIQMADCRNTVYEKYFCEETQVSCPSLPNNNVYLHCTGFQYCEGVVANELENN